MRLDGGRTSLPPRASRSRRRRPRRRPRARPQALADPAPQPVTSAVRPERSKGAAFTRGSRRGSSSPSRPARSSSKTCGHALERLDRGDQPLEVERAGREQLDRRLEILRLVDARAAESSSFQKRSKSATGFGSGKIATTTTRPRIAGVLGGSEDAGAQSRRPRTRRRRRLRRLSVEHTSRHVRPGSSAAKPEFPRERATRRVRLDERAPARLARARRARSAARSGRRRSRAPTGLPRTSPRRTSWQATASGSASARKS